MIIKIDLPCAWTKFKSINYARKFLSKIYTYIFFPRVCCTCSHYGNIYQSTEKEWSGLSTTREHSKSRQLRTSPAP